MLKRLSFFASLCSAVMIVQHKRENPPSGFISNGPAPPNDSITIRLALASNNLVGLEQTLSAVSDPANAIYGQYLSQEETKAFVQPSAETVSIVNAWAAANGVTTSIISPFEEWIQVIVPISKANALFAAQFTTFTDTTTNDRIVRTLSFSFPSELIGHVTTAHPMTTFTKTRVQLTPELSWNRREKRRIDNSCNSTITPACLEALYGIPTASATQKSNTLLVTGYIGQFAQFSDLKLFLEQFQPLESASTSFAVTSTDGGQNNQSVALAGEEANFDIQYTVGLALGVPVTFLTVGDGEDLATAFLDTTTFLEGVANPPSVMTTSYGNDESDFTPSLASQICNGYMTLGVRGISVLFASGDGGVRGGHDNPTECPDNTFVPVFPASCPYVTSVGATIGINPERAVNFTGGGFSNVFPRPSYQDAVVPRFFDSFSKNFEGVFNRSGRGYPDVTAQGVNFEFVTGGETGLFSGTSASSPTFASVIALINDRLVAAGKPVLGFLNPFIYGKAASAFTDITIGKNPGFTCPSNATGFAAIKGWDPVSGFGTPVFSKLLAAAGL